MWFARGFGAQKKRRGPRSSGRDSIARRARGRNRHRINAALSAGVGRPAKARPHQDREAVRAETGETEARSPRETGATSRRTTGRGDQNPASPPGPRRRAMARPRRSRVTAKEGIGRAADRNRRETGETSQQGIEGTRSPRQGNGPKRVDTAKQARNREAARAETGRIAAPSRPALGETGLRAIAQLPPRAGQTRRATTRLRHQSREAARAGDGRNAVQNPRSVVSQSAPGTAGLRRVTASAEPGATGPGKKPAVPGPPAHPAGPVSPAPASSPPNRAAAKVASGQNVIRKATGHRTSAAAIGGPAVSTRIRAIASKCRAT